MLVAGAGPPWPAPCPVRVRPPLGRSSLQNTERALASLDGLGLDKARAMTIVMSVMTDVLGAVLREVQELNGERAVAAQVAHLTREEQDAMVREFGERLRASGRYPHMAAMIADGVDPDSPDTRDERFEFGLGAILNGIAASLPHSPPPPPPPAQPPK